MSFSSNFRNFHCYIFEFVEIHYGLMESWRRVVNAAQKVNGLEHACWRERKC